MRLKVVGKKGVLLAIEYSAYAMFIPETKEYSFFFLSSGRQSVKSNAEFTPPIVTAVDFREPTMSQAVQYATK